MVRGQHFLHIPRNTALEKSEMMQNRIGAFGFCLSVLACVLLSALFAFLYFSKVSGKLDDIILDNKINLNAAPVASLIRLPGIGLARAEAIADYRANFDSVALTVTPCDGNNGTAHAFWNCQDLQKVKGIGPKTVKNIAKWLRFE